MARRLSSVFASQDDDEEYSPTHMPLEFTMRLNAAMMEAMDFKTPDMPFTYTPLQGKEIRLLALMVFATLGDGFLRHCIAVMSSKELAGCWLGRYKSGITPALEREKIALGFTVAFSCDCIGVMFPKDCVVSLGGRKKGQVLQ